MRILVSYIMLEVDSEYQTYIHLDCTNKSTKEVINAYFAKYYTPDCYNWVYDLQGELVSIEEIIYIKNWRFFEKEEELKDFLFNHFNGD
ncbi:MAG: hypothetical protein A2086_01730 [Spirochaetes bacterium GWD1_27_9]|nr:MAG: hypothetical protein A2Z98_04000 [Spirochaetes bacterium GWB1_27_13]OHD20610.1 MAG: hypothetical protein A2Y34_17480 [Spirochaetes bacterium GWC1_27_15]OHD41823.1 MAG: hypothetical protein A2086_01730 [Spirochaetes bacterium GWD1_27_9]